VRKPAPCNSRLERRKKKERWKSSFLPGKKGKGEGGLHIWRSSVGAGCDIEFYLEGEGRWRLLG